MKDGKEAVFILSHTGPETQGIAFFTRDIRIIEILKKTWDNLDKANKDGIAKLETFNDTHRISDFIKLFPNVKREQIVAIIANSVIQKKRVK
jgi:hypothetical protein